MSNIDHVEYTCYRDDCHAVITLHRMDDRRLRESHATFYCPVGHSQAFTGKSAKDKRIEELEAVIRRNGRRADRNYAIREELVGALKTCPFGCGYRSRRHTQGDASEWAYAQFVERVRWDITEHLRREHNATAETVRLVTERAVTHS